MNQQTQTGQDVLFALKQALVHEEVNGSFEIGTLKANFYTDNSMKMKSLVDAELTEAIKAMRKLMNKRMAKITRMATLSPLSQMIDVKITLEERELYHSIHNSCNKFKDIVKQGEQNVKE